MAYGAARHYRKKTERLLYPTRVSAPWLGPHIAIGPGPGRKHHQGRMYFEVSRHEEFPIGRGAKKLAKQPYLAKVCIGKPYRSKSRVSATQHGDVMGCEWGTGRTPTKALAQATQRLGRRLASTKRGR